MSDGRSTRLLHELGTTAASSPICKTIEGKSHPDRDAQFQYINRRARAFQRQGQPREVSESIPKKKELVGQYRNGGREVANSKGKPEKGEGHP